jgi:hypothetical protein
MDIFVHAVEIPSSQVFGIHKQPQIKLNDISVFTIDLFFCAFPDKFDCFHVIPFFEKHQKFVKA